MTLMEHIQRYTLVDYAQWPGDWELIQGQPVAMTPSPSVSHQRISLKIARQLDEQLEGCSLCTVVIETDWEVAEDTVVRPDIMVLCDELQERVQRRPELIVEVVSDSSARIDERIKYQLYAEEGVPWYILAYPKHNKAKIYQISKGIYCKIDDFNFGIWFFDIRGCSGRLDFSKVWEHSSGQRVQE
jgi:Uma2 family endonuclease